MDAKLLPALTAPFQALVPSFGTLCSLLQSKARSFWFVANRLQTEALQTTQSLLSIVANALHLYHSTTCKDHRFDSCSRHCFFDSESVASFPHEFLNFHFWSLANVPYNYLNR